MRFVLPILALISVGLCVAMAIYIHSDTHSTANLLCREYCEGRGYTDGFDNGKGCFCDTRWRRLGDLP